MSLGILSFLTPLPLLGLLTLPIIWWLLRTTPPSPDRQQFPPTRILKELLQDEKTSAHSPWWLTLLRLVAAALVILALSQPVLNSAAPLLSATQVSTTGPLAVVVDNGFAAANHWERRKAMMQRVLREAQAQQRLVYLVPTAPDQGAFTVSPMSAVDAMTTVERMEPTPFFADTKLALERLTEALEGADEEGSANGGALFYLSDGLVGSDEAALAQLMKQFETRGMKTHVVTPLDEDLPLGLRARLGKGGALFAEVIGTAAGQPRAGDVLALSAREEVLGRASFTLPANEQKVETKIDLPLELRNQIAKLRIEGQRSAGAVHLLDQRSSWRRIGLISNESGQLAQPLLSPLYYIRRALEPYAEIISGDSENVADTTARFTERNVSVIVMADIGRLVGAPLLRLTEWVEKGGVLVRFAGPHMEESQDGLLPTPLRQGGRRLGGALSWAKPQPLAAFDDASPFAGLAVPDDVLVTRQLLADPSRMRDKVQIWARLQDGTPLVTATRELDGWVVLVHVTANSDWSNLPLSGLFVDMLRRLSQLSISPVGAGAADNEAGDEAASTDSQALDAAATREDGDAVSNDEQATLLAPYRMLDGFGTLGKPAAVVEPVAFKSLQTVEIGPTHPPGFYGPANQTVALNLLNEDSVFNKADYTATGAEQLSYRKAVERALRAPLFLTALILLIVDSLVVLAMRGVFSLRATRPRVAAAVLVAIPLAGLVMPGAPPAMAQEITPFDMKNFKTFDPNSITPESLAPGFIDPRAAKPKSLDRKSMDPKLTAALDTHLAYVITGNAKVDQTSRDGLRGLTYTLNSRTAVEPAEPVGVRIESDELAFFPILYWPVGSYTAALSDESVVRVNSYMKQGGMIIFDTKDQDSRIGGLRGSGQQALEALLSRLDIPRLEPVPNDHVLTKSFYLLSSFPGRYQGGALWVEAASKRAGSKERTSEIDGVTTLMITSNDFASAWAVDQSYQPLYPVVPGGRLQREMAYRVGVNIVMYALAGNYKADQVHVPALLERLGQ